MEKNMKNIKKEFAQNGIFYTPKELAETLKSYIDFEPREVYDPTCGQGNLLSVFDNQIAKYGQELFADELEKAKECLTNFNGYCGNTLKDDGFKEKKFHAIVANPPFSIKWEPDEKDERFTMAEGILAPPSKADYAFILHILHHLAEDGKAVVMGFPGILYRGVREGKIRKWIIEQNFIEKVIHIPANKFTDTAIATCVIVFNKRKRTTDITFIDAEHDIEYPATLEEVRENNYVLSVNRYAVYEEPREEIDIENINNYLVERSIDRFIDALEKDKLISSIEKREEKTLEIIGKMLLKVGNYLVNRKSS